MQALHISCAEHGVHVHPGRILSGDGPEPRVAVRDWLGGRAASHPVASAAARRRGFELSSQVVASVSYPAMLLSCYGSYCTFWRAVCWLDAAVRYLHEFAIMTLQTLHVVPC